MYFVYICLLLSLLLSEWCSKVASRTKASFVLTTCCEVKLCSAFHNLSSQTVNGASSAKLHDLHFSVLLNQGRHTWIYFSKCTENRLYEFETIFRQSSAQGGTYHWRSESGEGWKVGIVCMDLPSSHLHTRTHMHTHAHTEWHVARQTIASDRRSLSCEARLSLLDTGVFFFMKWCFIESLSKLNRRFLSISETWEKLWSGAASSLLVRNTNCSLLSLYLSIYLTFLIFFAVHLTSPPPPSLHPSPISCVNLILLLQFFPSKVAVIWWRSISELSDKCATGHLK